jgi:hypothetical protein
MSFLQTSEELTDKDLEGLRVVPDEKHDEESVKLRKEFYIISEIQDWLANKQKSYIEKRDKVRSLIAEIANPPSGPYYLPPEPQELPRAQAALAFSGHITIGQMKLLQQITNRMSEIAAIPGILPDVGGKLTAKGRGRKLRRRTVRQKKSLNAKVRAYF